MSSSSSARTYRRAQFFYRGIIVRVFRIIITIASEKPVAMYNIVVRPRTAAVHGVVVVRILLSSPVNIFYLENR